jgi:membrane fusion protein (multidrug efflux system)
MKLERNVKILLFTSFSIVACMCSVLLLTGCKKQPEVAAPHPPDVEVVNVIQRDVPVYMEWVASTDGLVNADIRAQVQGYLIKQVYKQGDFVRKGQLLFEVDPRLYQAAVEQAEGQLAIYQAEWQTAKANLKRVRPLAERNAVSQKDLDDAVGREGATHASVIAAQAAVDKAKVNLGFTKVKSLIDGVAGIANAKIGDLVGPDTIVPLTVVSTLDPILVYVPASEQQYMKATEERKAQTHRTISLFLADGSVWPHEGEFFFTNRQVDPLTGTIKVAVTFPNPGNVLRPGQFARVRAQMAVRKGALLIPQRAVTELQGTYLVAVVGPDDRIDIRRVKPAETVKSLWVIDNGLKPGERVVAEGVQKVKQGMPVSPKPFAGDEGSRPGAPPKPEDKPEPPVKPENR